MQTVKKFFQGYRIIQQKIHLNHSTHNLFTAILTSRNYKYEISSILISPILIYLPMDWILIFLQFLKNFWGDRLIYTWLEKRYLTFSFFCNSSCTNISVFFYSLRSLLVLIRTEIVIFFKEHNFFLRKHFFAWWYE